MLTQWRVVLKSSIRQNICIFGELKGDAYVCLEWITCFFVIFAALKVLKIGNNILVDSWRARLCERPYNNHGSGFSKSSFSLFLNSSFSDARTKPLTRLCPPRLGLCPPKDPGWFSHSTSAEQCMVISFDALFFGISSR